MRESYGGFLPLEIFSMDNNPFPGSIKLQSARAALNFFLKNTSYQKIWMPAFTCDAIVESLNDINIKLSFYHIDDDFNIVDDIKLQKNEILLYINYFGICNSNVESLLSRFNPNNIIIDNSQALFESEKNNLATIYSLRKFLGVPDGGLLYSDFIDNPTGIEKSNIDEKNCIHLMQRFFDDREKAYGSYIKSESFFSDVIPRQISELSLKLSSSLCLDTISNVRAVNFNYLNRKLRHLNVLAIKKNTSPLCFPLLTNNKNIKIKLREEKIFLPTYWADANNRSPNQFEKSMIESCLYLPIDQRYNQTDMKYIAERVIHHLGS